MRQSLIAVLLTGVMTAGCALRAGSGGARDDWSPVLALKPSTDVVIDYVGPRAERREALVARGRLIAAGPSEISLLTTAGRLQVNRAAVSRISVVEHKRDSIRNGTFIGSAIGVLFGLVAQTGPSGEAERVTQDRIPVATAGIGAAVGASVDAVQAGLRTRVVYRRR